MSTDKEEQVCRPPADRIKVVLTAAAEGGEKTGGSGQRGGSDRQVCTSPGIATLTDNTKRFKLSSSQATQESPGMSQQVARKGIGLSVAAEEKRKKSIFGIQFSKNKKEKCTPQDKMSSVSSSMSYKGSPALTVKEDGAHCTKRTQTEVSKVSRIRQDNSHKKVLPSPTKCILNLEGNNLILLEVLRVQKEKSEEDMYRDAEEIEREKVLLVCGTGSADFPENKLSVEPEVSIMDYCQKEWKGTTSQAKCIRKGYEAVSQKFISIRRVRGDNYCAVRATLFQALSQASQLPEWLMREDMMPLPEKLMEKYGWISQWQLRQKWTSKAENLADEIKDCLMLLKNKWKCMSEMKTHTERQVACDELFRSEEDEYKLYEAVKFLMLNTAIRLYEDNEKGKEVPVFAWLLFARDTSNNPSQLMQNHLNQLGHMGGLEQVEMFLLAYALQHTIQVYRLYKYNTDEFITLYPNDPEEDWPIVTLITEDDRHYNIPARVCEETSL